MRKYLVAAVAASLIVGACGGSGPDPAEDPQGALSSALEQLAEYEGVTMVLSLDTTTDSLVAASEGDLTEEQAQQIVDSSITITSKGQDPENAQAEIIANVAGNEEAFQLKVIGDSIYARADVAGLMEMFGQDPAQLDAIKQQAGAQPGFEFVGPALDGEWIGVEGFKDALEQAGMPASQTEPSEAQQEAINKFTESLKANARVETGDQEGPGEHLVATVAVRDLYEDLSSLAGELGAGAGGELPPVSEIPDENFLLDTWVDDGRLTQVEIDFLQFADFEGAEPLPEGVETLALRVTFEEFSGDVEAPSDATQVDINKVMQGLLGAAGGGAAPGGAGGDEALCDQLAAQLEGQPQEVVDQIVAQYGDMCPGLAE